MRFIPYALAILIAITAFSCKKLDQLVSFNLNTHDKVFWETAYDTVLTDTIVGNEYASFMSAEYSFKDYDKFETNKSTPQSVESVEAFTLTILIDSGATHFGFADSMTVYLSSPKNLFKEVEIAHFTELPTTEHFMAIDMLVPNDDWASIIQKEKYQFRTEFKLLSPMPDSIYLDYSMEFRLKAIPND
ncbi:MAG TPA: hypothetical protein PL185_09855 [Flavobacteriales bacterium]|nr:hypothetical protein [Flavobacteriales bacterium]HPH82867.1 hypothetical protein [Flavobacteriales bacterium]